MKKKINLFEIDISHFTGQAHRKGKKALNKKSVESYLTSNSSIPSSRLREKLLEANYFQRRCYHCSMTEWNGEPIPLELHHIDCNHNNNELENLNILCPNCHALEHRKS